MQQGWQKNLLTFLLRDKAFTNVFHNTAHDAWWHSEMKPTSWEKLHYYCYKSLEDILQQLLIGYPILVVIRNKNQVRVVLSDKTLASNKVLLNLIEDRFHLLVYNLTYWEWSVETDTATIFTVVEKGWVCAIMLPLLTETQLYPPSNGSRCYAMVDKEWRELKEDGQISC
jgi:hypothetical protein